MAANSSPSLRYQASLARNPNSNTLIMYGGCIISGEETAKCDQPTNEIWAFDLETRLWTLVFPKSAGGGFIPQGGEQGSSGAVVVDQILYVYERGMHRFNLNSRSWLAFFPYDLVGPAVCVYKNNVIILGGIQPGGAFTNRVHEFNTVALTFGNLTLFPRQTAQSSVISQPSGLGDVLIAYGGYSAAPEVGGFSVFRYRNEIFTLSDRAAAWNNVTQNLPPDLFATSGACVSVIGTNVYLFGGASLNPESNLPISHTILSEFDTTTYRVRTLIPDSTLRFSFLSPMGCNGVRSNGATVLYVLTAASGSNLTTTHPIVGYNIESRSWFIPTPTPLITATRTSSNSRVSSSAQKSLGFKSVPSSTITIIPPEKSTETPTVAILGSILGALAFFGILFGIFLFRKRMSRNTAHHSNGMSQSISFADPNIPTSRYMANVPSAYHSPRFISTDENAFRESSTSYSPNYIPEPMLTPETNPPAYSSHISDSNSFQRKL